MRRILSCNTNSKALLVLKMRIDELDDSLRAAESAMERAVDAYGIDRVQCYRQMLSTQRRLVRETEKAVERKEWELVRHNVDMICRAALMIQLDCDSIVRSIRFKKAC